MVEQAWAELKLLILSGMASDAAAVSGRLSINLELIAKVLTLH
jgi:hypothetical protein